MRVKKWRAGPSGAADVGMLAVVAALSLALCAGAPAALRAAMGASAEAKPAPSAARPAAVPAGPVLAKLPIEVAPGERHMDLAAKLAKKDAFMALALSVESVPDKAYVDAAGANAGAGYCVDARRRAHGEAMVREDLRMAGFSEAAIGD